MYTGSTYYPAWFLATVSAVSLLFFDSGFSLPPALRSILCITHPGCPAFRALLVLLYERGT